MQNNTKKDDKASIADRTTEDAASGLGTNPTQYVKSFDAVKRDEHYRFLFKNMLNGAVLCKVVFEKGRAVDFIYLDANEVLKNDLGLDDIIGRTTSKIFPGIHQSDPEMFEVLGNVALTGEPQKFEMYLNALQNWFIMSVYSPEKGYLVIIFDVITERKLNEKKLKESEERYRLITDNITDVVLTVDTSGIYTFVSPSHKSVFGRGEGVLGTSAFKYIHPDDIEYVQAQFQKAQKEKSIVRFEYRYLHPERGYIWVEGEGRFFTMNRIDTGLCVARDITTRKSAEEKSQKLEKKLQQSYKMEAIGVLAGGIAHDFNNILSSVLGFCELAKMKYETGEDFDIELDEIYKSGLRARDLVKQILTFSRRAEIQREPIDVIPIFVETIKFMRASLPATIQIKQKIHADSCLIIADPTQIHQILMNICTNAAHAMQETGGELNIQLKYAEISEVDESYAAELKKGRYLQISISDTGHGITDENMKRIFDPFFTTRKQGEGTGLGLSVVHGIIKDMEGAVSVYSELGKGTTFKIFLPVYKGDAVQGHDSPVTIKTGQGRILLVDDEVSISDSSKKILERLGYQVISTNTPQEALEIFSENPESFDLVYTDLTMPGMTGLDLSAKILKIAPEMPIILSTGFNVGITPQKLRESGVREIVLKPVMINELSEAVFRALNS